MSLENDPFDDVPPEPMDETQPAELPPSYPEFYSEPTDVTAPPPSRLPRWALITLGVIGVIVIALVCLLFTALVTQNANRPTPVPTTAVPRPTVQTVPSIVTGGTVVSVRGSNFTPSEQVIFYLRNASRPADPILQIGTTQVSAQGTFDWSFIYPSDPYWTSITNASIIVQSMATGAYYTANMTVTPNGFVTPTILVPTREPPTAAPVVTIPPQPPTWTPIPPVQPTLTQTPDPNQWLGQYFNNPNLQGPPVMVRNDASINFNWGTGSPAPNIPTDYFSVSWSRTLNFNGGMYRFSASVDDGIRVWLDSNLIIDEWHTASPNPYSTEVNVTAGTHTVRVDYYEGVGVAFINFSLEPVISYPDWKGEYYSNPYLSGSPAYTSNDVAVSFDWGNNPPAPGIPAGNFSVRWTRTVTLDGGNYRFSLRAYSGVHLFVDGNLLISAWPATAGQVYTYDANLANGAHTFVIEYYNQGGGASVWFTYQPLIGDSTQWTGSYFANNSWSGIPTMVRYDSDINFNWGTGSPSPFIPVDNFSVRWTRTMNLAAGQYQFNFTVDDGVRFYVNNQLLLDKVLQTSAVSYQVNATLPQGNNDLRIEYVEYTGQALINFSMMPINVFGTPTFTPTPQPPTTTWTPTPQPPSPTPTLQPPSPTPTPTPTTAVTPTINSFTANAQTITLNQCVILAWDTSGAASPIVLQVNGQTLLSNLPATGTASHCPTTAGQQTYTLTITSSPNYGPISANVVVNVAGLTPAPH